MDKAPPLSILDLPDSLLLKVLTSLPLDGVRCVSLTCSRFYRIALDEQLWKTMFQREFKVPQSVPLHSQACSWRAEYRRLHDESPAELCEEILQHEDEVWHAAFSHNGEMFATSSKDGTVRIWKATTPYTLLCCADLRARFDWEFAAPCTFNQSDTLLLASGRIDGWNGEIAIFDAKQGFKLVSRVLTAPFDEVGTWFDDNHVLTGTHHHLGGAGGFSVVWLCKATREVESTRKYDIINPFRFYNANDFPIRTILVADVPQHKVSEEQQPAIQNDTASSVHNGTRPNGLKHMSAHRESADHRGYSCEPEPSSERGSSSPLDCQHSSDIPRDASTGRLLIMLLCEDTDVGHMVGIKRMTDEEIEEEEEAMEGQMWPDNEEGSLPHNYQDIGGTQRPTELDHVFNMHGCIVGMALSPDKRYLYLNRRRWPDNNEIEDFEPPPISEDVDIQVIDLVTMTRLDTVYESHKAYTTKENFFRIYLDVCDLYVASGAEDNQGYLWDRNYGVHVRCFPHDNVVNCCAFNPVNPQMLVTVSDDFKIKVWRSRRHIRELSHREEEH